jgi:F-type H+-transporting ATPase subunit b
MTSSKVNSSLRRMLALAFGFLLIVSISQPIYAQTTAVPANGKQTVLSETDQYRMSAPVVKIGALLGMKPETAANVFTLFNIVILFAGIGYGLMKVLPKTFRNRSTAIQKHLVDARTATEEATARLSSVEDRLAKLDDQIAAMRAQAEGDAARDEQRIRASVEDEKNKILAAAEADIQSATTLARREIQKYAAELAVEHAARKLVVTAETDRLLVENFAHRLGEGSNN